MTMGTSTVAAEAGTERAGFAQGKAASRRGAITIRLAKDEADAEAMIELGRRFHDEGPFFRSHPYQPERLRQIGTLGLAKGNPGLIMAELNGTLIGMAIVVAGEQFYSGEIAATVQLFYVAPEARGGRAALLLVRALRRWAHEAKATDLLLHVTSGIDAARTDRFLRKMGFKQTGGNYVLEGG